MMLAIDGYEANVRNRVGIGRYAYELLVHLYELLGKQGGLHTVRIYLPEPPLPDMPRETEWWKYRVVKPSTLWTIIGLPLALAFDRPRPDILFSPTHYIPRNVAIPRVMSIMDLSFLMYPELFRRADLYKLTRWTEFSARRARKIFTISQFSKNAIIRTYNVPEHRVVVTYPGFTMKKNPPDTQTKNYILSVGTVQPRKNYIKLIEAFASIREKLAQTYPDVRLVIAGKKGWLYEDILESPAKFGIEKYVEFRQFVPDDELPKLYSEALCFVLASLYEGFGLPVLEAMAYKCPVVVSNVSSLPEIAGDAGIYVDPNSVKSIAAGLLRAVNERNTQAGEKRVELGLKQVAKFTWKGAAEATLKTLEEVAGEQHI